MPKIFGICGYSGSGKTTLLEKVIPLLKQARLRVALIKHAHHDFDIDYPGKDSYRLREAGATETLVCSNKRWALIHEHDTQANEKAPDLYDLVSKLNVDELDIILVEGFKKHDIDSIEVHRPENGKAPLFPEQPAIIALATPMPSQLDCALPMLDLNSPKHVAQFMIDRYKADLQK